MTRANSSTFLDSCTYSEQCFIRFPDTAPFHVQINSPQSKGKSYGSDREYLDSSGKRFPKLINYILLNYVCCIGFLIALTG